MSENQPEIGEKELEQVCGGCEEQPRIAEILVFQQSILSSKETHEAFIKAFTDEA